MNTNRETNWFFHCLRGSLEKFTPLNEVQYNALCDKIEKQGTNL